MRRHKVAFTLIEMLVVVIIIGIIAALAMPGFMKSKQNVLSKEAKSNLKLIAAAEKIYRMESDTSSYLPCANTGTCNTGLRLDLNASNWGYAVSVSGGGVATLTSTLAGTPACTYTLTSANFDATPWNSGACPDGME